MLKKNDHAKANRLKLASMLPDNALAVISSAELIARNADTHFPFRQQSDFYWLSYFNEPDAILILHKENGKLQSILFHLGFDKRHAQWESARIAHEDATDQLGVDRSYPTEQYFAWMKQNLREKQTIWISKKDKLFNAIQEDFKSHEYQDLSALLMRCRLIKHQDEIAYIQQACDISVHAQQQTIMATQQMPYLYEYQVAATFSYHAQLLGAQTLAYPSIAASGKNACTLHYTRNDDVIEKGQCILLDAGCEYHNYAADITRVWPASGRFTPAQKDIYQAVLAAQKATIAVLKPGVAMAEVERVSQINLSQAMIDLGIIKSDLSTCLEQKKFIAYTCHSVGHALGLDVHDPSPKKGEWELGENMVLTIEPGLYFAKDDESVAEIYRGIGVRIEDDILITKSGHRNLTKELAKEVEDIEMLCSESP